MKTVHGKHARIEVKKPLKLGDLAYAVILGVALPCSFAAGFWVTGFSGLI